MDDSDALMHVQWLRLLESWRQTLQTPIEINVEQIIGGGQPLTRVNDINITAALTGTPATALLKPVAITFAWAGTLAPSRGGLGFDASGIDKGGLVVGTAPNAFALKVVGSNAQVLTADSTVAGGVKWATPVTPSNSTPLPILDTPDDNEGAWAVAAAGSPARVVTVTGPTGPAGPAGSDSDGSADDAWAFAAAQSQKFGPFTQGSVIFVGPSGALAQDNNNFFWDNTNKRLGIGTFATFGAPGNTLHVISPNAELSRFDVNSPTAASGCGVYQDTVRRLQWGFNSSAGESAVITGTGIFSAGYLFGSAALHLTAKDYLTGFTILNSTICAIGVGTITPTASLHIKAGTATASTAPFKLTSGTNLTTAEAGAVEYNGTNLFFTRAGTVRENVLIAIDNVTAPTTTAGVAIVNFYGSSATNFLGDPNRWLSVNVLGSTYKIPLYT